MRAIRPADDESLRRFHSQLSADTIYFRFFVPKPELSWAEARQLALVDYDREMAVVAVAGKRTDEQLVAVARYVREGPGDAEIALVVRDDRQHQGLGTEMLLLLREYARAHGIHRFHAFTLVDNAPARGLLQGLGLPYTTELSTGVVEYWLDLDAGPPQARRRAVTSRAPGNQSDPAPKEGAGGRP